MNIALATLKLSELKQAENAQLQFFSWSGEAGTVCSCYLHFTVCHDVRLQPTVIQNLDSLEALSNV